ncbi:MAG: branched-chain amino acid aminotransferase [Candidatus Hodarchaeales archaeon]
MGSTTVRKGDFAIKVRELTHEDMKEKFSDEKSLRFGQLFTDRMFFQEYNNGEWQEACIKKKAPFQLDPAAVVFHYGQEIFEGMKSYIHPNDEIALFRPFKNAERFNNSATRMGMPIVDTEFFVWAIEELVKLEREWIPRLKGASLYVRPTMIATESFLGVRPSASYFYYIILSPSGPFFPAGFNPVDIFVSAKYSRAAPGGTGEAKCGGNYAASLAASQEAIQANCQQVLWLDAVQRKFVEEVGAMNILFVIDGEIVTSPLTGTILDGVTRDSLFTLASDLGYTIREQLISIDEVTQGIQSGRLTEVFGCGTAAIIAPVGGLVYKDSRYSINDGQVGPVAQSLYDELTAIQYGEKEDPYGWIHKIK